MAFSALRIGEHFAESLSQFGGQAIQPGCIHQAHADHIMKVDSIHQAIRGQLHPHQCAEGHGTEFFPRFGFRDIRRGNL